MMNKWVKRKWLSALMSGEYAKGRGMLGYLGEYCCLGVLACEMVPEFVKTNGTQPMEVGDGGSNSTYLPDDLAILWGLDRFTQERLADKNDDSSDFGPVIVYIESNL